MKKRLTAAILTLAMSVLLVVPAAAATKPTSISITGKKTVYVGKQIELDSKISPKKAKVKDSKIVWTSSKPSVAKVMEKKDDDTKIKGMKAGTATITVKIQGTKLKATYKVTVKKAKATTTTSTSADEKKITSYKTEAKALKKEITNTKLASTKNERRTQYRTLERKIEKIEDKLEKIEDKWEDKYRDGKASRSTYRSIEKKVEAVEDYLDTLEDYLDEKFNYEFDD